MSEVEIECRRISPIGVPTERYFGRGIVWTLWVKNAWPKGFCLAVYMKGFIFTKHFIVCEKAA
jgi:hypothetical protein